MATEKQLTHSEQQAVAQLASIREMVAALECDYDRLEELREERETLTDAASEARESYATAEEEEALLSYCRCFCFCE